MPATDPQQPQRTARALALAWLQASRPKFYVASVIPVLLGQALASRAGAFDPFLAALTLLGAVAMQAGTNFANDYYDWVQYRGDLPFHGGSGVIQEGKLSPATMRRATWWALGAAAAAGAYLGWRSHPAVWLCTLLGVLSALYYTAPPVRYGYRGLAELGCGLSMGPLIVAGSHLVQTGTPSWEPVIASLPVGSLVALILYAESIHDIDEDRVTGKWTLAARLGEQPALRAFTLWVLATGLGTLAGAAAGLLPRLAAVAALPALQVLLAVRPFLEGRFEHADLFRLGRMARRLYLSTGVLMLAGAVLGW